MSSQRPLLSRRTSRSLPDDTATATLTRMTGCDDVSKSFRVTIHVFRTARSIKNHEPIVRVSVSDCLLKSGRRLGTMEASGVEAFGKSHFLAYCGLRGSSFCRPCSENVDRRAGLYTQSLKAVYYALGFQAFFITLY